VNAQTAAAAAKALNNGVNAAGNAAKNAVALAKPWKLWAVLSPC